MNHTICPTVTVETIEDYREQLEKISFAPRIHIDVADGDFASPESVRPEQIYWNDDQIADIHVMMQDPYIHIETLLTKQPNLIILHAESKTFERAFNELKQFNIKLGIALLPETQPEQFADFLLQADHCLIFGGNLGHQGGSADLSMLSKASRIFDINPKIELAWDGGASLENISQIVGAGVTIVNTGGAIHNAENPEEAYAKLLVV